MTTTHVLINVTDDGARVRVYRDNVCSDDYFLHSEDGDWRDHVPAGSTVTVR